MAQQLATAEQVRQPSGPTRRPHLGTWAGSEVKELIELYNAGCTMTAIGNQLHKTRNAVAGQLNRLRAQNNEDLAPRRVKMHKAGIRTTATVHPSLVRGPRTIKLKPPVPAPRIRLRMVDHETAVTLLELEQHHCRWPNGDPRRSDFRFCGCPRVSMKSKTPYCAKHTLLAGRHYEIEVAEVAAMKGGNDNQQSSV